MLGTGLQSQYIIEFGALFVDEAECCPLFCVVDVAFCFAGTLNGLSFGFRFRGLAAFGAPSLGANGTKRQKRKNN